MHIHKHIHFDPIDPLGAGLREAIVAEQQEPDAICLDEQLTEDALERYWQTVSEDATPLQFAGEE